MGNKCYAHSKNKTGIKKTSHGGNQKISMYLIEGNLAKKSELNFNSDESTFQEDKKFFLNEDLWYFDDRFNENMSDQEIKQNLLFDPKKFIYFYNDYQINQYYYALNWDDIIVDKPKDREELDQKNSNNTNFDQTGKKPVLDNWRYVIRKGIPLRLTRDLIHNIVDLSEEKVSQYNNIKDFIFRERSSSNIIIVPSFSEEDNILQNLEVNFLSDKGISALKRILWCLNDTLPKLEFNPMIINTIANLFLFLNEQETYFTLKQLLENSIDQLNRKEQNAMKLLRWHFTLNEKEFYKNAKLFIEVASKKSTGFKMIIQHFNDIKFTGFIEMFQNWSRSFFANMLSLPTTFRIFTIYLNEGVRVFYKIVYAFFIILKPKLQAEKDPKKIQQIFENSKLDHSFESTEKIFKIGYTFKIGSQGKDFDHINASNVKLRPDKIFYRPRLKEQSEIIKYSQFEQLWQWLPKQHKMTNPIRFFSTSDNGYSLQNLYQQCYKHLESQLLILIKTQKSVIGCFLDEMVNIDKKKNFYGGQDSFVFQIFPNQKVYKTDNSNKNGQGSQDCHILSTLEYLQIGTNEAAIVLEHDLNGYSRKSETYNNEPLHVVDKDDKIFFQSQTIELYALEI